MESIKYERNTKEGLESKINEILYWQGKIHLQLRRSIFPCRDRQVIFCSPGGGTQPPAQSFLETHQPGGDLNCAWQNESFCVTFNHFNLAW